ncbi:Mrp/NBP35 family ATP-binding protein, partial [Acholeplasma sp. OttesenSCG-928-E16]|nr:Mrp/NBP35 family ATP-binding protein [Acholeplasma sp. OttesenSCG-928-E16]
IPQILNVPKQQVQTDDNEAMIPLVGEGIEVMSVYFFMGDKPLLWRGPMLGKMLDHFFHGVKWADGTEVVIIDLPPGTGDVTIDVQRMLPQTKVLVVTTPHVNASVVAFKAGTGSIELGHEIIGVVENMSYYVNPVSKAREHIFGEGGGLIVASKLQTDLLAQIPIGQPKREGQFTYENDEENGIIYDRLAKKVIAKLNL